MSNPSVPKHVAIIMDGNGRWAKKKGMLRSFGHKSGVESVRTAVRFCRNKNPIVNLVRFCSENWFPSYRSALVNATVLVEVKALGAQCAIASWRYLSF